MAIQCRLVPRYLVLCDGCGVQASLGRDEEEALILARDRGWQHISLVDGLEQKYVDLCPSCSEEGGPVLID